MAKIQATEPALKDWTDAEKSRAQNAVDKAVAEGTLPHVSTHQCQECGVEAQHYHHESYAREDWLNVIPYCARCHRQRHVEMRIKADPLAAYTHRDLERIASDHCIENCDWRKNTKRDELVARLVAEGILS